MRGRTGIHLSRNHCASPSAGQIARRFPSSLSITRSFIESRAHAFEVSVGRAIVERERLNLRSAAAQSRWITFLDLDEFLFSPQQRDIHPILEAHGHLASLQVRRATFGSSGHRTKPPGGVLESYTRRAAELRGPKSIANPRLIRAIHNPHQFSMWGTGFCDRVRNDHY